MLPGKAIFLLRQTIESGNQLLQAHHGDERITEWNNSVQNLLSLAFGEPSDNLQAFHSQGATIYYSGMPDSEAHQQWLSGHRSKLAILNGAVEQLERAPQLNRKTVFLVHGHNEGVKEAVARHLQTHGMKVTILHEQADRGKTIVEKFEHYSNVPFAVILATADDQGRPRQNVILEMGYFLGKLGRNNVFVLVEDGIEMPSDYSGVLYIPFRSDNSWRERLLLELREAHAEVE